MANSNKINVPEAREAMNKFKMEAANEMGVNLKQGYNGDLTSSQAGSIGGRMVKKMCPIRSAEYSRSSRIAQSHTVTVRYHVYLSI